MLFCFFKVAGRTKYIEQYFHSFLLVSEIKKNKLFFNFIGFDGKKIKIFFIK